MYSGIPQHPNFDLFGLNCRKAMRDRERNENSYRAAPHASLVGHVKTGSPLQWYRLLIDVDPPFCCNGAKKHTFYTMIFGAVHGAPSPQVVCDIFCEPGGFCPPCATPHVNASLSPLLFAVTDYIFNSKGPSLTPTPTPL